MSTLHTFGCSITQGFALPDTIRTLTDDKGQKLTEKQILDRGLGWEDIHLYRPSDHAWPAVLASKLEIPVINHARRGSCFQQIARQCAVVAGHLRSDDIIIVMWTYLSRFSLQWPSKTAMPLCTVIDPYWGWRTRILPGFNKFFGLSDTGANPTITDQRTLQYIRDAVQNTYLDPRTIYDRYHNSLILQVMVDGALRSTGARVIHLSVEPESYLDQLESARQELDPSLRDYSRIPDPKSWYSLSVDHDSCLVIHDPSIPPAANDTHPSVQHHGNFADLIYDRYFA